MLIKNMKKEPLMCTFFAELKQKEGFQGNTLLKVFAYLFIKVFIGCPLQGLGLFCRQLNKIRSHHSYSIYNKCFIFYTQCSAVTTSNIIFV